MVQQEKRRRVVVQAESTSSGPISVLQHSKSQHSWVKQGRNLEEDEVVILYAKFSI